MKKICKKNTIIQQQIGHTQFGIYICMHLLISMTSAGKTTKQINEEVSAFGCLKIIRVPTPFLEQYFA